MTPGRAFLSYDHPEQVPEAGEEWPGKLSKDAEKGRRYQSDLATAFG